MADVGAGINRYRDMMTGGLYCVEVISRISVDAIEQGICVLITLFYCNGLWVHFEYNRGPYVCFIR